MLNDHDLRLLALLLVLEEELLTIGQSGVHGQVEPEGLPDDRRLRQLLFLVSSSRACISGSVRLRVIVRFLFIVLLLGLGEYTLIGQILHGF
ncbi:MAG: hypothetical protein R3E96_01980 [Planctomycetota bacterium]